MHSRLFVCVFMLGTQAVPIFSQPASPASTIGVGNAYVCMMLNMGVQY